MVKEVIAFSPPSFPVIKYAYLIVPGIFLKYNCTIMKTIPLDKKLFLMEARPYALIALAALLVMAPQFIQPGYYYKIIEDVSILPKYIPQFAESFRQGIFYPRWMAEDFNGCGSPEFVFYSPLLFLVTSLLNLAGLDQPHAVSLVELLSLYLGGVFIFIFLRGRFGDKAAFIAALCYILLPGRLIDLYYLNSPSQRMNRAWMPLSLFFTREVVTGPLTRRKLAGFGISYAAMVLTHIASTYIFTPFIIAYGLFGVDSKAYLKNSLRLSLALLAGLCLSSIFFLPAVIEKSNVHIELFDKLGYWHFFVFNTRYYGTVDYQNLFKIASVSILAETSIAGALFYLAWKRAGLRPDREIKFFIASLFVCLFIMSYLSGFLWKIIPGLSTVVFSYRFISIYLIFLSALFGIAAEALIVRDRRPKAVMVMALVVAAGFIALDGRLLVNYRPISEADAVRYASNLEFNVEDLKQEYLPRWADIAGLARLDRNAPLLSSKDEFSVSNIKWGVVDRTFAVDSPRGARLRVKTFWFPGWKAWVDGTETAIAAEKISGAMLIDVPPGSHKVSLKFTDTPPRVWGKAISLITLAALVFPYGAVRRRRRIKP